MNTEWHGMNSVQHEYLTGWIQMKRIWHENETAQYKYSSTRYVVKLRFKYYGYELYIVMLLQIVMKNVINSNNVWYFNIHLLLIINY